LHVCARVDNCDRMSVIECLQDIRECVGVVWIFKQWQDNV